jgi:hypothetical protein
MITEEGFRRLCSSVWSTIAALALRETSVRISLREKLPLYQLSPYTDLLFIFVYPSLNNVVSSRLYSVECYDDCRVINCRGIGKETVVA